jgi:hypothetical protein
MTATLTVPTIWDIPHLGWPCDWSWDSPPAGPWVLTKTDPDCLVHGLVGA